MYRNCAVALVLVFTGLGLAFVDMASYEGQKKAASTKAEIHGALAFDARDRLTEERTILSVPDVEVYLKDAAGKEVVGSQAKTDLNGRYVIPRQPGGEYYLHWRAKGFKDGSLPKALKVQENTVYPPLGKVEPQGDYVFGRVSLRDRRRVRFVATEFGIDTQVRVHLVGAKGKELSATVRANNNDYFLIPAVKPGLERVVASTGLSQTEAGVLVKGPTRVDLTFPYSAPKVERILHRQEGKFIREAKHGMATDMHVRVIHAKPQDLEYKWLVPGATKPVIGSDRFPEAIKPSKSVQGVAVLVRDKVTGAAAVGRTYITSTPQTFFKGKAVSPLTVIDTGIANGAAVRVSIDPVTLPLPLNLIVHVPQVDGKPKIATVFDELSVIVGLPPNQSIQVDVQDIAGNAISTASRSVNSGPAVTGIPPYPYDGLNQINFVLDTAPEPAEGFLTFLDNGKADSIEIAKAYYKAIDPNSDKDTLEKWKMANGFNVNDDMADDASAVYFNGGDLGLGRWMHMKKTDKEKIAYYVSNYGIPPATGLVELAADAKIKNDPTKGLIATVAMEYGPGPKPDPKNPVPYTRFYVFNNKNERAFSADLDGRGQKFIPTLCIVCHGGQRGSIDATQAYTPNDGNVGANFIPFDLASFQYSTQQLDPKNPKNPSPFSRAAQEDDFRKLNKGIFDETRPTDAVRELVKGWYGNNLDKGTFNENFVPDGWLKTSDKSELYNFVVKTSCRSCHVTRGENPSIDWTSYKKLDDASGLVQFRVCSTHEMPQALVTFRNFWLSTAPFRPGVLANSGLSGWDLSSPCPSK